MFTKKTSTINQLPDDILIQIISHFDIIESAKMSGVSKDWERISNTDRAIKTRVLNSITVPPSSEIKPAADAIWKLFKRMYIARHQKYHQFQAEKKIVEEDEKQIADRKEFAKMAMSQGVDPGYGLTRKDTCGAAVGGMFGGSGIMGGISALACPKVAGIFAFIGCFSGCILGFWGRSYHVERRAKLFREKEAKITEELNAPLLEDGVIKRI